MHGGVTGKASDRIPMSICLAMLAYDGVTLLGAGGMKGEFTAGEIDRLSGSHGLVGGEYDRQARETVLQVRGQVELLANGPHEELLFAPAELVVTGLVSLR